VKPQVSIIVPVYNEGTAVVGLLDRIFGTVATPCELLAVYDFPEDTTVPPLQAYAQRNPQLTPTLNTYGRGPANAIRYGIEHAAAPVVVVTMADGSDEPELIEPLTQLVEGGAVVAAASRYSPGGRQIGGPFVKRTLSRLAGLSLYWLARVGTRDATSSFKAYSKAFVDEVGIDSREGFEIAIELVAKARRLRRPVAELPTTWANRVTGESNFRVLAWLPAYLRWYFFAFGPQLDVATLRTKASRSAA
jgi:dolichol-phosphate mannosyltransferase